MQQRTSLRSVFSALLALVLLGAATGCTSVSGSSEVRTSSVESVGTSPSVDRVPVTAPDTTFASAGERFAPQQIGRFEPGIFATRVYLLIERPESLAELEDLAKELHAAEDNVAYFLMDDDSMIDQLLASFLPDGGGTDFDLFPRAWVEEHTIATVQQFLGAPAGEDWALLPGNSLSYDEAIATFG